VSNKRPKFKPKAEKLNRTRSWIIRKIHSGEPILDRLKEDFNKARVNPATLNNTENVLEALLQEEYLDFIKLQVRAKYIIFFYKFLHAKIYQYPKCIF
jgi:hypothetical protein